MIDTNFTLAKLTESKNGAVPYTRCQLHSQGLKTCHRTHYKGTIPQHPELHHPTQDWPWSNRWAVWEIFYTDRLVRLSTREATRHILTECPTCTCIYSGKRQNLLVVIFSALNFSVLPNSKEGLQGGCKPLVGLWKSKDESFLHQW